MSGQVKRYYRESYKKLHKRKGRRKSKGLFSSIFGKSLFPRRCKLFGIF